MHRWVLAITPTLIVGLWYLLTARRSRCESAAALFTRQAHLADHVDHFCAPLRHPVTIDQVADAALQRGQEVARSSTEVLFEDRSPGLRFTVAYELIASKPSIQFSTAVSFESWVGRWYFFLIRPFHRLLAPAVPIATARRAIVNAGARP